MVLLWNTRHLNSSTLRKGLRKANEGLSNVDFTRLSTDDRKAITDKQATLAAMRSFNRKQLKG